MEDLKMMKRRDFLRLSALATMATVAAACTPAAPATTAPATSAPAQEEEAEPTATTAQEAEPTATTAEEAEPTEAEGTGAGTTWTGEIEFYAQSYTPSNVLINPDPNAPQRMAMQEAADAWVEQHPGITFTFINAPAGDYINWLETQLIGGTGPDIFWIWLGSLNSWADDGKTVPLNDYLELPNKYTPDDQIPWKETFKSPFLTSFSAKGNWGGVPMDLVSTGIYTNESIFEEVGIDLSTAIDSELGSPPDWATFMEWHQAIKDAGYFAFGPGAGIINQWWTTGVMADQFLHHLLDECDILNYHELTPIEFQEGIVSQEEVIMHQLCNGYEPFQDPAVRDMYRVMKEWSQYFPEGFANEDFGTPYDLFVQGQLAMFWDGSWTVGPLLQDNLRQFEFTSFWMPPVTRATSEYVPDPPYLPIGVGGYGSLSYGLNRKTIQKGNVEACVDWLMFITTPEWDEKIVNEVPSFIPANKKAKSLPEVENLFVGETRLVAGAGHPISGPYSWYGWQEDKWGDIIRRETTLFLLDESDLDTFMANLEEAAGPLRTDLIQDAAIQYSEDGNWDLTQWPCEPAI